MAYRLEASGAARITPTVSDDDGLDSITIPSDSSVVFEAFTTTGDILLSSDAPVTVPLGPAVGAAGFNYVNIRVKGGYCKATLTSDEGDAVLYVEPRLVIRSDNNLYTALILERPTGVEVVVAVYLGRRS